EVERDKLMTRTSKRPLVNGSVTLYEGWLFGVFLLLVSIACLLECSYLSVILLLFTILFYVFYTIYLKPWSDMNIVIGGIAGALPVLIGWYAVHDDFSIVPYMWFVLIFLWTPAHFWALAIYKLNDYKLIKLPMRPLTIGVNQTVKEIFIYTILTVLTHFILNIYAMIELKKFSIFYFFLIVILNLKFIYKAYVLQYSDEVNTECRQFFLLSIKYLLFGLVLFIFYF
ncbi:MAG: UbiA family prenyltransferase, partial [Pseudomonadota bacterium]